MALADSLARGGKRSDAYALLDRLIEEAKAHGDLALQLHAQTRLGNYFAWYGEPKRGVDLIRQTLPQIEALGDSALGCDAMVWLGISLGLLGSYDEADSVYRKGLPLAVALGDRRSEAFMRLGSAYAALQTGRSEEARDGYQRAAPLFQEIGDQFGELDSRTGLGRAYTHLGDLVRARTEFERILALAKQYGLRNNEADAWNNLGDLEFLRGDPEAGLRFFRNALRIRRSVGIAYATIIPGLNVARALAQLGRTGEAEASLDSLLATCQEQGFREQEASVRNILGEMLEDANRPGDAISLFRSVVEIGEQVAIRKRLSAYCGVARCLAVRDSVAAGLAVLRGPAAAILDQSSADDRLAYDLDLADVLMVAGEYEEASTVAQRAEKEAERLQRPGERVRALTVAGMAELHLGRVASARKLLERGGELWELVRKQPVDYEWRENRSRGQELCAVLVEAILTDPSQPGQEARAKEAFDAAQQFKARTLIDRARGPAASRGGAVPDIDLATLQANALGQEELFLDAYVGQERSFLFAVTTGSCEVVTLPGQGTLDQRVDLLLGILADPPRGSHADLADSYATACAAAESLLLGGLQERIRSARVILFAPDGPLHRLPLEVLLPPAGAARTTGHSRSAVVARVPCAAIFAETRRGFRQGPAMNPSVLHGIAIGGGRSADGRRLRGASREVAWLAGRFRGIKAYREMAGIGDQRRSGTLSEWDLLHVAAHTYLDDQHPWRSGVRLGGPADADSVSWLRAERIVGQPLRTRLVVLSGCESGGGRVIPGEGIQGLTSAFLAAGVPAVVATLWPVEDRATFDLMRRFYGGLEHGLPVGEALQSAKDQVASRAATSSPFYWAGFILVGEPDLRVGLHRRALSTPAVPAAAGLGLLAVLVAAVVVVRRRHSRIPATSTRTRS